MADLGTTIIIESSLLTPANGKEGAPSTNSGANPAIVVPFGYPNDFDSDRGSTLLFPSSVKDAFLASSKIKYFLMRGWYAAGSTYESWVAIGAPNSTPPTGRSLSDIIIVMSWLNDAITNFFDPTTLTLTGWWQAPFSASPWIGKTSVGASGSRNLVETTNPPTVGTTLNSYNTANFDGTNDKLTTGAVASGSFWSTTAGSGWVLFNADTAAAAAPTGTRYTNPGLVVDSGGGTVFSLSFHNAGVSVNRYGGAWEEITLSCSTLAWHLAQYRWSATQLQLRIDSGPWSLPVTINPFAFVQPDPLAIGVNYSSGTFFDGRIVDVGTMASTITNEQSDNIISYVNRRYALNL